MRRPPARMQETHLCACHRTDVPPRSSKASAFSRAARFTLVDFPLFVGTLLAMNGVIFGSALVPRPISLPFRVPRSPLTEETEQHDLSLYEVRRTGESRRIVSSGSKPGRPHLQP